MKVSFPVLSSRILVSLWLIGGVSSAAWAMPAPPATVLPRVETSWPKLTIRVDVRNITGPSEKGEMPLAQMSELLKNVSLLWDQCAIEFVPRSEGNVAAQALNVPYEPRSQADLSLIAAKISPRIPSAAIPLIIAGPWNFVDNGLLLYGLGWAYRSGQQLAGAGVGAMIAAQRLREKWATELVGHELGHALSLNHRTEQDNMMAGGKRLIREQCTQARFFSETVLTAFLEPARPGARVASAR